MGADDLLSLAKRRGFFWPSYEIYGGTAGFYDYGPLGSRLKSNVENIWRRYYVQEEGFFEINCPAITPEVVFEASGHLAEFSDLMVQCKKCGQFFRADHVLEEAGVEVSAATAEVVGRLLLKEAGVKCPNCSNHQFGPPQPFNLMFGTMTGPGSAGRKSYMRPETAQGMFLNFQALLRHNRERLPFGAVQLGRGYRNEISPRQALIRLREFNMAEAEVFVHPEDKSWPRFEKVKDTVLRLLAQDGVEYKLTAGEAVEKGMMANQALAYFIVRTQDMFYEFGIDPEKFKFRQHRKDEMAHYASDCWDGEALTSLGWIEIVGIADRGCFDLSAHIERSGQDLDFFEAYDKPREEQIAEVKPIHKVLGPMFREKAKAVAQALESFDATELNTEDNNEKNLTITLGNTEISVPPEAYTVVRELRKVSGRRLVPHVIEPSYGIDRIIFTILEHALETGDDGYKTLKLTAPVAPIQVAIFPLIGKNVLVSKAREVEELLRVANMAVAYDDGGSIGRRYARMDEVGTPYCVTVDFEGVEGRTEQGSKNGESSLAESVTIRDRDSKKQTRVPINELATTLKNYLKTPPDTSGWEKATAAEKE